MFQIFELDDLVELLIQSILFSMIFKKIAFINKKRITDWQEGIIVREDWIANTRIQDHRPDVSNVEWMQHPGASRCGPDFSSASVGNSHSMVWQSAHPILHCGAVPCGLDAWHPWGSGPHDQILIYLRAGWKESRSCAQPPWGHLCLLLWAAVSTAQAHSVITVCPKHGHHLSHWHYTLKAVLCPHKHRQKQITHL